MSTACPRCGTSPVDVEIFSEAETRTLGGCRCYPHPPMCVSCRRPLGDDGRCQALVCPVAGAVQPDPLTDPLYDPDLHGSRP